MNDASATTPATTSPPVATATSIAAEPQKTHAAGEWKHTSPLLSCRFDPSGQFVFCSAQDCSVQRWNIASGAATPLVGHESWVRAIAFQQALSHTYTGGYDGQLITWETAAEQPKPVRSIAAHDGWIRSLATSPDGKLLASCGNDRLVKLWSTDDGRLVNVLQGHTCHVYSVTFHPDGQRLVSGDLKGQVREWDLASGEQLRTLVGEGLWKYDEGFRADIGGVRGIGFSHDAGLLACGGISEVSNAFAGIGNPLVVVFDYLSGQKKQACVGSKKPRGTIWNVHFHPDGFLIGTDSGHEGGHLLFWKLEDPNEFFDFKLPNLCYDSDLHPDKLRMVTAHQDNVLRLWRMTAPVG
jgi:WD40 repeat protein